MSRRPTRAELQARIGELTEQLLATDRARMDAIKAGEIALTSARMADRELARRPAIGRDELARRVMAYARACVQSESVRIRGRGDYADTLADEHFKWQRVMKLLDPPAPTQTSAQTAGQGQVTVTEWRPVTANTGGSYVAVGPHQYSYEVLAGTRAPKDETP